MNTNINHPTKMIVNIKNFKNNIKEIRNYLNEDTEIMPIVKASAYGTYLNTRLDILNMFNIIGVANPSEGIYIRNIGYQKDIFVLNQIDILDLDNIINNNLIIGVSETNFINNLIKLKTAIRIHLEIETGMNRTGINQNNLESILKKLNRNNNIIIEGVYTHLSSPDSDRDYTLNQLKTFDNCVKIIQDFYPNIKYIHALSSNGIILYPKYQYNLVRPGLIIYGYSNTDNIKMKLKPVAVLKSRIIFIKKVPKNTSIGYSRNYQTKKESVIATIPIGYADGFHKNLLYSNVLINSKKAKVISICMDSIMVDVTDIKNIKINDDVYIWDNINITIDDIANYANTINYEILCNISNRIPRIFI